MTDINKITIPLYEFDADGAILPNPVFHRSWDKLHSRTIEYPFTASRLGDAKRILDVGSVKGDSAWTNWLESLPIDVHVTDYDADDEGIFQNSTFHHADVRDLPIEDNVFDKILAVSVIEHIGMAVPQVVDDVLPPVETDGDIAAFKELLRVLKPGGEIVMTLPFGKTAATMRNNNARIYSPEFIQRFHEFADPIVQDYYEYQRNKFKQLYIEYPVPMPGFKIRVQKRLKQMLSPAARPEKKKAVAVTPRHFGLVTWRRLPMEEMRAGNLLGHTDGILCGVWRKRTG